jgi:ElaB/YqjD/DUF883 family membrane-anchored ribosome-binding protein
MTDTDDLRKELNKLKTDLANLRDSGGEQLHTMRESAEDGMHRGRRVLRRGIAAGRDRGRRALAEMEEEMGAHPYVNVLAAVGVGFILAKLLDIATRD